MIKRFVGKMCRFAGAAWRKFVQAVAPENSHLPDKNVFIAASEGNVMNTGKRYRKTSGHSPIFSLFTFFGLRS